MVEAPVDAPPPDTDFAVALALPLLPPPMVAVPTSAPALTLEPAGADACGSTCCAACCKFNRSTTGMCERTKWARQSRADSTEAFAAVATGDAEKLALAFV
eukprot:XP_001710010.1 Hypothetical protein GL50803_34989 [Giardia lamblia ATCC 50803]